MGWFSEWREIKSREIPEKTCGCGRKHYVIPEDAKLNEMGYFWNCECKSTLFYPIKKFKDEKKMAA